MYRLIADPGIARKPGARSRRGIFEAMMTDAHYPVPDNPAVKRVVFRSLFEPAEWITVNPEKG